MIYVIVFVIALATMLFIFLVNEGNVEKDEFILCLLFASVTPIFVFLITNLLPEPNPDDIFMKSTQSALNTIIKVKNEAKLPGEIVDLEKENLILGGYDKGYAIKVDDNQFLYITDEVINEPQAKINGKLSMLYINEYPLPKSKTCIAEYKDKEGKTIRTEYISCDKIEDNLDDELKEETIDTEISKEEVK